MSVARYRVALRTPGIARVLVTSLVARMPLGMASLGILLLVTRHHGYARAGVVTGLYVAAGGVSNVALSRAADRYGARPVLARAAFGYAAGMTALALVPPDLYAVELAVAVASGLSTPPVVAVVRGLWPRLLGPDETQAVYGLEATAQELIFIAGPALVALVAGVADAPAAVVLTGALGLVGTLACVSSPALRDAPRGTAARRRGKLRGTGLPVYMVMGCALVLAFNTTDVAVVAFISGRHASASAGVALAVWSLGSLAGGLWFGADGMRTDDQGLTRGMLVVAAGVAVAAAATGPVVLAVLLFVGGMTIAPVLARLYARVGAVAPQDASTEAFGWIAVGLLAGASAGAVLGGVCVQAIGSRGTFLLGAVAPAVVSVVLTPWARRRAGTPDHRLTS